MEQLDIRKMQDFEQRLGCRFCGDGEYAEMSLPLGQYRETRPAIPGVDFGFYRGDLEPLQAAVLEVDKDWGPYFTADTPVFCGFIGSEIVSFCIVEEDPGCILAAPGLRIGSIGCVGTVPAHRGKGIGLRMVDLATAHLQSRGFHKAYIHYTHIDGWYARLGYQTFARFSF